MCGIFGILKTNGAVLTDNDKRMAASLRKNLAHRGPDGSDSVIIKNKLILGHTRLAINDLEGGRQPFSYIGGDHAVINGEIYNYNDVVARWGLSADLITKSDCEVFAPVFLCNPEKAWGNLQGMYAAAVYSSSQDTLYLARDYFGEKPLYYMRSSDSLIFSSEVGAIIKALFGNRLLLGNEAVAQYMLYGSVPSICDLGNGLCEISRGGFMAVQVSTGYVKEFRYTPHSQEPQNNSCAIEKSILSSTISDVPLCIGLSGGIDSSYIASCMSQTLSHAFTVGYDYPGGSDEVDEARQIALMLGINHTVITISSNDVYRLYKESNFNKDLPISDIASIGYHSLYQKAAEAGYKVIMMGHGGDEMFLGYPWLYESYLLNRSRQNLSANLYNTLQDHRTYLKLLPMVLTEPSHLPWSIYPELPITNAEQAYPITVGAVTDYWLEPNSLRLADSLSMAFGLETRQPLLSLETLCNMMFLETHDPSRSPKQRLREKVSQKLRPELIQKQKKYFTPPIMHFYQKIHAGIQSDLKNYSSDRYLSLLPCLNQDLINKVLYSDVFEATPLTYYLFPRLAALHHWLEKTLQP